MRNKTHICNGDDSVVVTGAGSGIGLEFVRYYASAGRRVVAVVRDSRVIADLDSLSASLGVDVVGVDVRSDSQVAEFQRFMACRPVGLFLHCAGVKGADGSLARDCSVSEWLDVLDVNLLGAFRVFRSLQPSFAEAGKSKAVMISSISGAFSSMSGGGMYQYRTSKVALNRLVQLLAVDFKGAGVCVYAMHPGWVRTRIGGSQAPLGAADSVRSMCDVISGLTACQSGFFFDWQGRRLQW